MDSTTPVMQQELWSPFFEEKLSDIRLMLTSAGTLDDVVEFLHDGGLSAAESVNVISRIPGMSEAEAKRAVVTHPVWTEVTEAVGPVWDDVQLILEREGQLTKLDDGTFVYQERLIPVATEHGAGESIATAAAI